MGMDVGYRVVVAFGQFSQKELKEKAIEVMFFSEMVLHSFFV